MENDKTIEEVPIAVVKKIGRPRGSKDTQPRKPKGDTQPITPPPIDIRTHRQKLYDSWFT